MFYDRLPGAANCLLLPDALYDPGTDRLDKNMALAVEQGRIAALVPAADCPQENCQRLPGLTLLPGLIDTHVHLCLSGCTGETDALAALPDQQMAQRLRENLARNLRLGVTTVRDLGCPARMMDLLRQPPAGPAPRVVASGPAVTVPQGHGAYFGQPLQQREEIGPAIKDLCAMGADWIKIMVTGGNLTPGTDVETCQFSQSFLQELTDAAHAAGKKVACHVHGLEGVWQCIRAGVDSVEHASYMDEEAEQALAEAGIWYVATICPGKLLQGLAPAAADRVHRRWELIRRGAATGVRFGAGTDAGIPGVPHGSVVHEVQELARLGLGPRRALRAATADNAALLGLADCCSLRPGCAADLVGYRGDPVDDLTLLERPSFVMRAGVAVRRPEKSSASA